MQQPRIDAVVQNLKKMLAARTWSELTASEPFATNDCEGVRLTGLSAEGRYSCVLILEYHGTATKSAGKNSAKLIFTKLSSIDAQFKDCEKTQGRDLIILMDKPVTKAFRDLMASGELFEWSNFYSDLLSHYLQPKKIRLLNLQETKELLADIQERNMPKIRQSDPVVKYFAARTNQVFHFTDAHGHISYRLVA
jgi:DNA-directed RNA polymerase subunit H (RpoH/RPB5)